MEVSRPTKAWTVLIYTSASRDLETAVEASLQEITEAGAPEDVQVVAQMGAQGLARRYRLHDCEHPQELEPAHPTEMSRPEELRSFLLWAMEKYPARHYAVVLGGHGAGFGGAITDSQRRRMMSLPELEGALGELPQKPELVVFNTCLMAQAEVASQLQTTTPHLVASQSELRGLGLPLAGWIRELPQQEDGSGAATLLAASSQGERAPAVSAIDLQRFPSLQQSMNSLASQILKNSQCRQRLRQHIQEQPDLWPHPQDRPLVDQIDLARLCRAWQADPELPPGLRQRAAEVAGQVGLVSSGGLSIYAPDRNNGTLVEGIYARLEMSRRTLWDEAINSLVK